MISWLQKDLSRKQLLGPLSYTSNKQTDDKKWFNPWKLWKITLEGSRRHHAEAWTNDHESGLASLSHRPAGLPHSPLALRCLVCVSKIYIVDFKAVIGQFIQRWSRELTWIDDVAMSCPLLHLPYIRRPLPSLGVHPSFRSRYTTREKSPQSSQDVEVE